MIVENNKIVSIHYILKNEAGEVLQENKDHDPEEYLHGAGNLVAGLERALEGMKVNEVMELIIPADDAYGPVEKSLIIDVPNTEFEDIDSIHEGDHIQLFDGTDAVVVEMYEDHVVVDANHPLAGQTLYYTIKVSGIRDAREEEIEHGGPINEAAKSCGPEGCC